MNVQVSAIVLSVNGFRHPYLSAYPWFCAIPLVFQSTKYVKNKLENNTEFLSSFVLFEKIYCYIANAKTKRDWPIRGHVT